jgi:alanyl-tRNA synthetase
LNNSDYLRFDFSHFAKMTDAELKAVEQIVNEKIRENIPVIIKEMAKDEALKLGAMALFGEKYGDLVRVVVIDPNYSVELCGGTHVGATGELGIIKILSEGAVAAGVRRVEALSGAGAWEYINGKLDELANVSAEFKNPKDLLKAVQNQQSENTSLKKQLEKFELDALNILKESLRAKIKSQNGVNVLIEKLENVSADGLKKIVFDLKNEVSNLFFVAASVKDDKAYIAILISDNLVKEKNWNAGTMVKELAKHINGGGGGQPFFASASGTNISGIAVVLKEANAFIGQ